MAALTFTPEIAALICDQLSEGKSLREVCRQDGMPPESTVRLWAMDDRDGFAAQYAKARELGYHAMADDLLDIADDKSGDYTLKDGVTVLDSEAVSRARLRVDTRKWMLSKALPKIYGEKLAVVGDKGSDPVQTEEVGAGSAKLAAFIETIAARADGAERS